MTKTLNPVWEVTTDFTQKDMEYMLRRARERFILIQAALEAERSLTLLQQTILRDANADLLPDSHQLWQISTLGTGYLDGGGQAVRIVAPEEIFFRQAMTIEVNGITLAGFMTMAEKIEHDNYEHINLRLVRELDGWKGHPFGDDELALVALDENVANWTAFAGDQHFVFLHLVRKKVGRFDFEWAIVADLEGEHIPAYPAYL